MTEAAPAPTLRAADLGLREHTLSSLPGEHVRRVAATLDRPAPAPGAPMPLLWHWAFFTPETPTAALGADGHPAVPADGPLAALPRRMWAGGSVRWHRPLRADRPAERVTRVASVQEKRGRSGRLLLVTLRHDYEQDAALCVEEEQDLVYREPPAAAPGSAATAAAPAPPVAPTDPERAAAFVATHELREAMLARYSAVTFNAHRIHYDRPYATEVEGYPGVVVHGPLLATLITEAAAAHAAASGRGLAAIRYRAVAPAIAPDTVTVTVDAADSSGPAPAGGGAGSLVGAAHRSDGTQAMQATFELTPTLEER